MTTGEVFYLFIYLFMIRDMLLSTKTTSKEALQKRAPCHIFHKEVTEVGRETKQILRREGKVTKRGQRQLGHSINKPVRRFGIPLQLPAILL